MAFGFAELRFACGERSWPAASMDRDREIASLRLPRLRAARQRLKKPGIDLPIPRMQRRSKRGHLLGHLLRQVPALPNIVSQVVKVDSAIFIAFDQLQVASSNCAAGEPSLIGIVRVVPEQVPNRQLAPCQ